MNEKEELKNIIKKAFTQKDFFITNKEPVYTIKECLETIDNEILDCIYMAQQQFQLETYNEKIKENPSHEEKIMILEKKIMDWFKNAVMDYTKTEREFMKSIKNGKTTEINIPMLTIGFVFGFKEDGKNVYIMPKELINCYEQFQNSDEKKQAMYRKASLYIGVYMFMNGIMRIDLLQKIIINHYKLEVTKEQIKEIILKDFQIYKKEYCTMLLNNSEQNKKSEEKIDSLLEAKQDYTYKILDEDELEEYGTMMHHVLTLLQRALKKSNQYLIDPILFLSFLFPLSSNEILGGMNLSKKEFDEISKILENHQESFRYWTFNGRTEEEVEREILIEQMTLSKLPENDSLQCCLDSLSKESYQMLKDNYDWSKNDNLKDNIIETLKEEFIEYYDEFELEEILNSNNKELTWAIDNDFLENGFVYLYKENETIKCFIPKEIIEIVEEAYQNETIEEDFISAYVNMNGVITKEKLQQLLRENHDIELDIEEIDYIADDIGVTMVDDYYTWFEDIKKEDILEFMELKDKYGKYKKADLKQENYETEFKNRLEDLIISNLVLQNNEELYFIILNSIKFGHFNEQMLEAILEDFDVSMNSKTKMKIIDLYKQYKKYISIWNYNGYSITDIQQIKKEKIGRNDLCVCGSGKKYKKCCGK